MCSFLPECLGIYGSWNIMLMHVVCTEWAAVSSPLPILVIASDNITHLMQATQVRSNPFCLHTVPHFEQCSLICVWTDTTGMQHIHKSHTGIFQQSNAIQLNRQAQN